MNELRPPADAEIEFGKNVPASVLEAAKVLMPTLAEKQAAMPFVIAGLEATHEAGRPDVVRRQHVVTAAFVNAVAAYAAEGDPVVALAEAHRAWNEIGDTFFKPAPAITIEEV